MSRIIKYCWFVFVMRVTGVLPDLRPIMRLRGWLARPAFRRCGRRFEIASGVTIVYSANVEIGNDVYLASGSWIQGVGGVRIDDEVMFGPYTIVASNNHTKKEGSYRFGAPRPGTVVLERGAWTGAHVCITAGVRVGTGAACAAGAVVTRDVPPHAIVGGVPARVLRENVPDDPQPGRAPAG